MIGIGGFASVRVGAEDAGEAVRIARALGLAAWKRAEAPAELRVANPRFGPVVATAPRGTAIVHTGLVLTGFHGLHVTLGTLMLMIILGRVVLGHFSSRQHFGFEAVAWYWHFVDVVWIGLFLFVYVL